MDLRLDPFILLSFYPFSWCKGASSEFLTRRKVFPGEGRLLSSHDDMIAEA